jgi:hypothetical protein
MAMDVDQCPRESRTLQPDYTSKRKIKAFSHDGACMYPTDTTSCAPTHAFHALRTSREMMQAQIPRHFFRQRENTDKI